MKLVILGGSGFVGSAIIEQALNRNFSVIAVARNLAKLDKFGNRIEKLKADYFDLSSIASKLEQADVVISTIGPPENRKSSLTADDFAKAMNKLISLMENSSSKRFIQIASAGSSYEGENINVSRKVMRKLVSLVAPLVIPAKEQELTALMNSSLKWTSIRPPLITRSRKGQLIADSHSLKGFTVDVNQLAGFILDCAEKDLWIRQTPFVMTK